MALTPLEELDLAKGGTTVAGRGGKPAAAGGTMVEAEDVGAVPVVDDAAPVTHDDIERCLGTGE